MACNITQTQAKTFTYATTLTNRFYINGDKGIAPGGSVVITLPLYTQLTASVDPTKPNQYAEWWQGQNMQIFASPTATPAAGLSELFERSGETGPEAAPVGGGEAHLADLRRPERRSLPAGLLHR